MKCECIDCTLSEFPCEGDCDDIICLGCEERAFELKEKEHAYQMTTGLFSMVGKRLSELH